MTRHAVRIGIAALVLLMAHDVARAQQRETIDDDQLSFGDDQDAPAKDHPTTSSEQDEQLGQAAQLIIDETNEFRRSNDLPAVETNSELADAANYFATYMARTNRYGHRADGKRPSARAENHGYDYCLVSENIAYAYNSTGLEPAELTDQVVQGWIESEGHRENMLAEDVTEIGVAVARDDQTGYHFAVQMFGRPRSAAIEFTVTNRSMQEVGYQVASDGQTKTFTLPARARITHTRCRPPEIQLETENATAKSVAAGDRFVIRADGEQPELEKVTEQPSGAPANNQQP